MMSTFQMIILIILMICLGCLILTVSLRLARYFMKRPINPHVLFRDLRPKLWMTACLGLFFFSLYAIVVLIGAWSIDPNMRQELLLMAREHTSEFIYGGLLIFMTLSLSILVVRSFIKRVYNSRK